MTTIRKVTGEEDELLIRLAELHCACLPGSTVTRLGSRYATHFYRMLACSPSDHVLVAIEGGDIPVGALVLSEAPALLSRRMVTSTPLILYLLARPVSVVFPLLKCMVPGAEAPPPAGFESDGQKHIAREEVKRLESLPELTNLFVSPERQGTGLGTRLIADCLELCRARGFPTLFVKSAAQEGNPALRFYRQLGFGQVGIVRKQGRQFVGFTKSVH